MAFETRVTVFPEVGGFRPDSFGDLLQRHVEMPGLDPGFYHLLIGATVADDLGSAELVIHSEPMEPLRLDRALRVRHDLPSARVKAHDTDGNLLVDGAYDRPLQVGEPVLFAGEHYRVAMSDPADMWPHRHPESGACHGQIDWQHVTLVPDPQADPHPSLAAEQPEPKGAPGWGRH